MAYYRFGPNDVYYNRIKVHPKCDFFIYDSKVYYNNNLDSQGKLTNDNIVTHVSESGNISLYELNVDRPKEKLIYPFVTKDGTLTAFKTVSTSTLNKTDYGDEFRGVYPLSASITRDYFSDATADTGEASHGTIVYKRRLLALKNTFDKYGYLSHHYKYDGHNWNKGEQIVNLINIPSIFYGSSIKKGTVDLQFRISGALAGQLKDENRNGELIQVGPYGSGGSGSVAGVVLYNEGFIALTGTWAIDKNHTETYEGGSSAKSPKWVYFAAGARDTIDPGTIPSSSFSIAFSGTSHIPTLTMMAHAKKLMLNHSNNPTYIDYESINSKKASSDHAHYRENSKIKIKNIVSSSHCDYTSSFAKHTFISQIGLYDDNNNLVAIAKLATPVRKRQEDDFTFKLKVDL